MKRIPMSQEGRAEAARRQKKLATYGKLGVTALSVTAVVIWGLLIAAG